MRAEPHEARQDRRVRVGLHGVVDVGVAEARLERVVLLLDAVHVDNQRRTVEGRRRAERLQAVRDREDGKGRGPRVHADHRSSPKDEGPEPVHFIQRRYRRYLNAMRSTDRPEARALASMGVMWGITGLGASHILRTAEKNRGLSLPR
jgi:hypothetical protein